jgi:hypothetical protein
MTIALRPWKLAKALARADDTPAWNAWEGRPSIVARVATSDGRKPERTLRQAIAAID